MSPAETQKTEIVQLFSSRRRNQLLVAIPIVAALILLVLGEGEAAVFGIPMTIIVPAAIAVVIGGVLFSLFNWRCPACNKYLGKSISPKYCQKCGVQLS